MISLNPLAKNGADKVPVSKVLYFLFFLLHKNIMMMIKTYDAAHALFTFLLQDRKACVSRY